MRSVGLLAALSAVALAQSNGVMEINEEEAMRRKTPPPAPRQPRYIGVDVGREPGRSVQFSPTDAERIAAAQAKRDRKAAKRNREAGFQKAQPEVPK